MSFTDYPAVAFSFERRNEKDIFIRHMGFNNFEHIRPVKYFRVQRFYTLHIVLEGSGTVKVKDKVYKASKGDMFFIPPDVNLCYYPEENDEWKYIWFEFVGDNALIYGEQMGFREENYLKRCRGFENIVLQLGRIFTDRLNNIPVGYYDVLSVFFKILDTNIRKSERQNIADTVATYIVCNYAKAELNVPDICRCFNISHSYLCKIFKDAYGLTVKNYIIKIRIDEACRLLEITDMTIKEIAYSVGFLDNIHFMKIFKQIIGKTPTQYRRNSIYQQ